ncbi:MAG: uracil-DNA glycosylase [Candidatus Aminicenantaceae bacterium]
MEERAKNLLINLEERLKFFSQLGIDFLSSSSESKTSVFHDLNKRILNCQKCDLSQERKNAVPGEGNLEAELMFVGEAPGYDEDIQGQPFVGKAGKLLTKIINAMNFQRQDVYITNVVKCRPPQNRNPYRNEIDQCKHYLLEQIEKINPAVIVALGKVATDFFISSDKGMTILRGNFHDFNNIRVMPTFHPSYLIRNEGNREIRKMVWEDMKKVMAFLSKK